MTERKESVSEIEATQQQWLSYVSIGERSYAVAIVAIVALGKEVCQRMGALKNGFVCYVRNLLGCRCRS
jgi:hypothetical protein